MEHDRRACPRCGEPAGDYRFCESCRSHLESLMGIPAHAGARASDSGELAAQAPREALGFEQSSAGASNGDADRITSDASATAVQVQPEPHPAEARTDDGGPAVDVAKLPSIADERAGDQPPREVARLEEVLTIAPSEGPPAPVSVAPPQEVELPTTGLSSDSDWARLRRQVARLEQLLSTTSADHTEGAAVSPPPAKVPEYVAADALREAFWFEQASAFKSIGPPVAPEPEAQITAQPELCVAEPQPYAQPLPVVELGSQRPLLATLCLIALLGLVAVLTGRSLRKFSA